MRDEGGIALLIVMIVSVLFALLGLSMILTSSTDFSISHELEGRKKAFLTADAGYEAHKDSLRGNDLSTILAATTAVPQYINYTEPTPSTDAFTYFSRNPLAPLEVINVDFQNPPTAIATRTVKGLLTPAGGTTLTIGGRYWAKISDNDDGDSDLSTDVDGKIYLRVIGIQRIGAGQVSTYGTTVKNSVASVEATLKRDGTLDFKSPFTLYGPAMNPAQGGNLFSGNSFQIDGYDHPGMTLTELLAANDTSSHSGGTSAGIDAVYDDPGGGDADDLLNDICGDFNGNQANNVTGPVADASCGGASIQDGTDNIRNDPNPDAQKLFDATYVMTFVIRMASVADVTLADGTNASGQNFGDDANPLVTYCAGNCTLGGGGQGVGLLIVRGRLDFNASFSYRGLILVTGDGEFNMSGANVGLLGGLLVAQTIDNGDGTWSYGTPGFTIAGNSTFYYQTSAIQLGYGLIPMKKLSWRQITPEIEPAY